MPASAGVGACPPTRPPGLRPCRHAPAALPVHCSRPSKPLQGCGRGPGCMLLCAEAGADEAGTTTTTAAGKSKPTPLIVFWTASTAAATACIENTTPLACGRRGVGNEASKVDWSAYSTPAAQQRTPWPLALVEAPPPPNASVDHSSTPFVRLGCCPTPPCPSTRHAWHLWCSPVKPQPSSQTEGKYKEELCPWPTSPWPR